MAPTMSRPSIVLFDGVCNLCNGTVRFILRRDPRKRFVFAPLQSEKGRELLQQHGMPADYLQGFVLIEDGQAFIASTAALRITRRLSGLWPIFYALIIIPRFFRDAVYRWIARNRYDWFGRKETCPIPTPEERARFLA